LNIFFVVNLKNLIFPYIRCDRTLLALYKKQEKTSLMDKAFYDFTSTYRKVYGTDFKSTINELLNNDY
jgi:hypothetical protein